MLDRLKKAAERADILLEAVALGTSSANRLDLETPMPIVLNLTGLRDLAHAEA